MKNNESKPLISITFVTNIVAMRLYLPCLRTELPVITLVLRMSYLRRSYVPYGGYCRECHGPPSVPSKWEFTNNDRSEKF